MNSLTIREYLYMNRRWLIDFLSKIVRIPSMSGQEQEALELLYEELTHIGINVTKIPIDQNIVNDPDYSNPIGRIDYSDRYNIKVQYPFTYQSNVPTIVFNTHIDTVPPSTNQINAFTPVYDKDGFLSGRGSVDAKGQIAVLVLLLKALKEFKLSRINIVGHIVVEEEIGGNGTLSILKSEKKIKPDILINLEPTSLRIKSSVRGAIWFEITFYGKPSHSGSSQPTQNAIKKAIAGIKLLTEYHTKLKRNSENYGLFSSYENPMPLTIGCFNAGSYPSMVADKAVVSGVMGFLPNTDKFTVMKDIRDLFEREENLWISEGMQLTFTYRHDGFETSPDNPYLRKLIETCRIFGLNSELDAMTASSDAIFYSELGIPSVIFGPGCISLAHSDNERINIDDILLAVEVIFKTIESINEKEMVN